MIKGLLFDKDGTLFDFNLSWGRWAYDFINGFTRDAQKRQALSDAFLFDYEEKAFHPNSPIVAGTSEAIFSAFRSVFPDYEDHEIQQAVNASIDHAVLTPVCDLPDFLGALKEAGFHLGVATNDSEAGARSQLERENALAFFDYVAGYDTGFGAKPDAAMCVGFLEATGLGADEVAMVGDSQFDLMAGRAAGMRTIGVLTGTASREDLRDADIVLQDISEIPDWIKATAP